MIRLLSLSESRDDFAKRRQTLIDSLEFKQMLIVHVLVFVDLFTSGEIAEVELPSEQHTSCIRCV